MIPSVQVEHFHVLLEIFWVSCHNDGTILAFILIFFVWMVVWIENKRVVVKRLSIVSEVSIVPPIMVSLYLALIFDLLELFQASSVTVEVKDSVITEKLLDACVLAHARYFYLKRFFTLCVV